MNRKTVALVSKVRDNQRFTQKYGQRVFTVKVFSGDATNDNPEFSEHARLSASIDDFLHMDSCCHMIKVDIRHTNDSLLSNLFRIIRREARKLNVPDDACNMAVLRITGANWRFPSHFDTGHQIVVHLQGEKTWYWIVDGEQHCVTARPGDVLVIPAGVWHATRNETTSVMLNYGWVCPETRALAQIFAQHYPNRVHVVRTHGDK